MSNDIPETITREEYVSLIEGVGLDPNNISSLEFHHDGVYVNVFERDRKGNKRIDQATQTAMINGYMIKVVDG